MERESSHATVLFTDIVDSTKRAAELGNRAWRALLQDYYALIRRELRRFGGREANTAGDGFLAVFAEPVGAVRCAAALSQAVRALDLEVRSGLHMGQVERLERTVGGIAVHIGARVAAQAAPGEVLVSSTVRDALEGSEFGFEDRGTHVLKNVPGEWRLFALASLPAGAEATAAHWRRWPRLTVGQAILGGVAAFVLLFIVAGLYVGLWDGKGRGDRGDGAEGEHEGGPVSDERAPAIAARGSPNATHRQVTFVGDARAGALSPDGNAFAYIAGQPEESMRLMVQDLRGGEARELAREKNLTDLSWSPDGTELLFRVALGFSERSGVYIVSRFGGQPRAIRDGMSASWSPDGSRIASHAAGKDIALTNTSTGDLTVVPLTGSFLVMFLDWAPSKNYIAVLTTDMQRFTIRAVTPDGKDQHEVYEDSVPLFSPRWSPAGDAIYFLRANGPTQDLLKVGVSPVTGRANGPATTLLTGLQTETDAEGLQAMISLSRDGKRLLYTRGLSYSNLWLVEVAKGRAASEPRQLTTGTTKKWLSDISPDGKWGLLDMSDQIFVLPLEGGGPRQLTFLERASGGVWSADGGKVAFGSAHGGGPFRVWTVEIGGGGLHQFKRTHMSDYINLAWSPGPNILYNKPGGRNISVLNPITEEETALVQNDSVGWICCPHYSPDGKRIAVHWNRPPARGTWVISLEDSSQILVKAWPALPIGWSADSSWVYVWNSESDILRVRSSGGEPEPVLRLPFDKPVTYVTMAPDGKRFVVDVAEDQSEIWMAENFDPDVK